MLKEKIIKAYNFAKEAHKGQKRKFRDVDYFIHPKSVARLVEGYTRDEDSICAALLHDVVEDTNITNSDIELEFGEKVAILVMELTNNNKRKKELGNINYFKEKLLDISSEALTIKLCDILDNITYVDKDCKTNEQMSFTKRMCKERGEVIKFLLEEHNKDLNSDIIDLLDEKFKMNKTQVALCNMILSTIELIKIKYLWE